MNDLTCTLNLPLGPSLRDPSLEADLQARIEDGHRVFVVGDIHGHLATFRALLHRLQLKQEDRLICLGDMIDRGPASAELVKLLREDPRLLAIKGNHEQMAAQCIQTDGRFEAWQPWMQRGGKSTYGSYIVQASGDLWQAKRQMLDDFMWLDQLPTQIVLDDIRLVHAGYDPRMPLDMQGEKELLWIRKEWFNHDGVVDPYRTVFFGHTTTTKLGDVAGEVAFSHAKLVDGRPAWVGVDIGAYNHVAPGLAAVDVSSFRVVIQPTLRCDRWFERINTNSPAKSKKGSKFVWKGPEQLKEAEVSISFGLRTLATRSSIMRESTLKAQRELEQKGIVFPSSLSTGSLYENSTKQGYRILQYREVDAVERNVLARGPSSFRIYRQSYSGKRIRSERFVFAEV